MHCTTTGAHKDARHQKPCCKAVSTVHILTGPQLLCSRFGAMWDGNLRESTKLWTCDTEWVQNSTSTQEYCSTDRSEKGVHGVSEIGSPTSPWLPLRAHGGWRALARDLMCPQANSNGPEADVHWLHQEECPYSLVSGTVLYGIEFPISTLSLPKIAPHCHWDTRQ